MTDQAKAALYAAKTILPMCGRQAARRYCERNGIPLSLYRLARQLIAANNGVYELGPLNFCFAGE